MSEESMNPEVTSDDKLWAALSWIPAIGPWVALVVLLMEEKKNRPFIKYHAVHSLAVAVVIFLSSLVLVGICLGIIAFFVMFYWAYQAYEGKTFEIPLITDFVKNQGWI
jgi:uncharacterized membrane protein